MMNVSGGQASDKVRNPLTFTRRGGVLTGGLVDSFIRCRPEDETNGFFVACLVRKPRNTVNPLKRQAEEELDDLIAIPEERERIEGYDEWYGISVGEPGLASQAVTKPRKRRKRKKRG